MVSVYPILSCLPLFFQLLLIKNLTIHVYISVNITFMTNLEHKLILCDISILTFDKNFQPLITTLTVNLHLRMMVILHKNLLEVMTIYLDIFLTNI